MTVRIRKHLDSDTLHIPELAPLVGKDVEIIVTEDESARGPRSAPSALFELAGKDLIDERAIQDLRKISMI